MSPSISTVANSMITDIHHNETQSVAFWSDCEKVVKHTGEIACAVFMTRYNTLKCHTRNKIALESCKGEWLSYLRNVK